jgi:DNA-binding CsgD family transcriptional regulator
LSDTELEILRLVATGMTNREIGRERSISEATVKKHITNINTKLGTANRTEAMRRALELGLVTVGTPAETSSGARDFEAARHLATELERTRRRSRHQVLWFAAAAAVVMAATLGIAYAYVRYRPPATAPPSSAQGTAGEPAPWLVGVDLPAPVTGAACATSPGEDAVYVISGRGPSDLTEAVLRYRAADLRWERLAVKPTPVESASAVALQGRILVPGGCRADGRATAVVEVYDPGADAWSVAAPLPAPVCGYALVVMEGDAFLFGGRTSDDPATALGAVWRYRPDEDAWVNEGEMPLPRSDLAAVADGSKIRLLGGRDRNGRPQSSHWIFRPFADIDERWDLDSAPSLPEPRAGLGALKTPVGSLIVVGGGWDKALRDGTVVLGADGTWQSDARLPGFTPQRGAGFVLSDNRWAVLVGGQAEHVVLNRHYRREVVAGTIFVPAHGGG